METLRVTARKANNMAPAALQPGTKTIGHTYHVIAAGNGKR